MKDIRELLEAVEQDKYACYKDEWQSRAVATLNNYYYDNDYYDNEIFDLESDEWEELVKHQLDSRGCSGLLFFLGKLEPMDDWATLDGYGNAVAVNGEELVGYLKDIQEEIKNK